MYNEYKQLNLPEIDLEMLKFWEKEHIFQKSISTREDAPTFVFYEGPPSANGMPGIHHVMARTIKDMFCRFHTMLGEKVERKGGWDTHGLPIELSVESELGITKEDIGKSIGIDEYNAKCRETVMRYKDKWDEITKKMGYWVDLENPYITYTNEYIETVWWLIQQLYKKNLLYKGYTIQPYSPAAGTGLSSHELNMPGAYKEIRDISAVAQFKQKGTEDTYFLAWTTTPWTLPSNTALAVGPQVNYAWVSTVNPYSGEPISVILADDLISRFFKPEGENAELSTFKTGDKIIPYAKKGTFKGAQLAAENLCYEQLLPYALPVESPEKPSG